MKDIKNTKFRLASISNDSVRIKTNGINPSDLNIDNIKFQFRLSTVIDFNGNCIVVTVCVRYLYGTTEILSGNADFNFAFPELISILYLDKENNSILASADLFPPLLSAAYSTLRGIIFSHTKGSSLVDFPVPLIDTNTLVEKNGISVA